MTESRTRSRADRRDELERHLRERLENGDHYFKSKFVAEDLGLSASEVGALLPAVEEAADGIAIEKWGYSSATTWRVVADD